METQVSICEDVQRLCCKDEVLGQLHKNFLKLIQLGGGMPSGTVYPALQRLEKAGLLGSGWEDEEQARTAGRPRRRTYRLTTTGWRALPDAEAKLEEVRRLLGQFGTEPKEA